MPSHTMRLSRTSVTLRFLRYDVRFEYCIGSPIGISIVELSGCSIAIAVSAMHAHTQFSAEGRRDCGYRVLACGCALFRLRTLSRTGEVGRSQTRIHDPTFGAWAYELAEKFNI